MEANQAIGATVRRLRLGAGLTLEQLGLRCGMDLAYVSRVERGLKDMQVTTVVRLACALGVQPAKLLEDVRCPEDPVRPAP